jgi:DNA-binding response OmpR family regulator
MRAPTPRANASIAAGKILIVEDERDLVRLLKRRFELAGYQVDACYSAESGLKSAREDSPVLILLDIELPAMDGLTLLGLLRKESRVPVILLSGRSSDVDRILGIKAGADDYVAKPFSVGELLARVECVLRRRASDGGEKKRRPSAS